MSILPPRSVTLVFGPRSLRIGIVVADGGDPIARDGERLVQRKSGIGSDDLAVMQDQVRFFGANEDWGKAGPRQS